MTFLPIIERELRLAARRSQTYWMRFLVVLVALAGWLLILLTSRHLSNVQLSRFLFIAAGVLALGFSLFAGIFLTADCLSEEKREGTLGLLFLTDLKGYDVVLGKLAATSTHSIYGLLAIFPVLALPILIGGVSPGEFWRVVLVLLATLFLSLCMGLGISALNRDARQAMAGTFLGMLLLSGVLPALWWAGRLLFKPGGSQTGLLLLSPVQTYRAAFDFCYRTRSGPNEFWTSLALLTFVALAFLALAALILPRVFQDSQVRRAVTRNADGVPSHKPGSSGKTRVALLERNPFWWLAARDAISQKLGWRIVSLLLVLWTVFLISALTRSSLNEPSFVICLFLAYALHQTVKWILAIEATRQLSLDRQTGALELLLVSPLREEVILAGQRRALKDKFRGLRRLLVGINLCLAAAVIFGHRPLSMNHKDQAIFLELFAGGLLAVYVDFGAIATVGMWTALRAPRHHRAVFGTLGRLMLVPWAAIFFLVLCAFGRPISEGGVAAIFAVWFLIGITNSLIVQMYASLELGRGFRELMNKPARPRTEFLPGSPRDRFSTPMPDAPRL